jgi:hypothetical protein
MLDKCSLTELLIPSCTLHLITSKIKNKHKKETGRLHRYPDFEFINCDQKEKKKNLILFPLSIFKKALKEQGPTTGNCCVPCRLTHELWVLWRTQGLSPSDSSQPVLDWPFMLAGRKWLTTFSSLWKADFISSSQVKR